DDLLRRGEYRDARELQERLTAEAIDAQQGHNKRIRQQYARRFGANEAEKEKEELLTGDLRRQFNTMWAAQHQNTLRLALTEARFANGKLTDAQRLAEALSGVTGKRDMGVIRPLMEGRFRSEAQRMAHQDPESKLESIEELDGKLRAFMKDCGFPVPA